MFKICISCHYMELAHKIKKKNMKSLFYNSVKTVVGFFYFCRVKPFS